MSAIAKQTDRPRNAIDFLPDEFQKSVRWFYGFYAETLKGTVAIATRFRWWVEKEGLTIEEAQEAMRILMTPERSAEIDTSPKAIAALSAEVGRIIRDRREREKAERLKAGLQPCGDVERIKELLASRIGVPE